MKLETQVTGDLSAYRAHLREAVEDFHVPHLRDCVIKSAARGASITQLVLDDISDMQGQVLSARYANRRSTSSPQSTSTPPPVPALPSAASSRDSPASGPSLCPSHYADGQRAGPHTPGTVMACGCCAGTCEICGTGTPFNSTSP